MTAMPARPAPFDFTILADVDAVLNALAFVFLVAALIAIKRGNVTLHKRLIFVAVGLSATFLVSYLTYHFNAPPVKFTKPGWIRWVYYPLLITHIVLAAVQVPLILRTLYLGLKDRREQHKKWAKVTTPIWLYVSISGVVVYLMLYRM
jgi:putative membrane protein